MQKKSRESRRRPRAPAARQHVGWTPRERSTFQRAEVADVSEEGIGLVVRSEQPPLPDGLVRILASGATHNRSARIVWTAPGPDGRVRVGCRWQHHA